MRAKTLYGEYKVVGYESIDTHYPVENKPLDGFVYVDFGPNEEYGAFSKKDILNWDDLPVFVELSERLKKQRENSTSWINKNLKNAK